MTLALTQGSTVTGKIWLSAYQPGIPAEIDTNKYMSWNEMLELNCSRYSNLPALSNRLRLDSNESWEQS